jgi:hypothetical protein
VRGGVVAQLGSIPGIKFTDWSTKKIEKINMGHVGPVFSRVGLLMNSFFTATFMYFVQYCFICRHSNSTVSEDAGIEPRIVCNFVIGS